ncbi:MAG TPA: DUF2631 domain-containing protein [Jatrophihabitans sp.]
MAADSAHGAHTGSEVATGHGAEVAQASHERREDWGWHHEFTTGRQIAGWFTVVVLILLLTSTHYNQAGSLAFGLIIVGLIGGLLFDRKRRKTQWRS